MGMRRNLYRLRGPAVGQKVEVEKPAPRRLFVIGWGGMRGVLSLAAAVSLPYALPDGRTFPQRSMITYLAFCLIVATLVVQGLTLPWLIRRLGLSEPNGMKGEEHEARRVLLREALVHLDRKRLKNRDQSAMLGELIAGYHGSRAGTRGGARGSGAAEHCDLGGALRGAVALIRLWEEGQIDDDVLRTLQRELDLEESRVHTGSAVAH